MFEYFDNQIQDLPIPDPRDAESHYVRLGELGREAHDLFALRSEIVHAYREVAGSLMHEVVPLWYYHDPAGAYGDLVEYSSDHPHLEGHILGLRVTAISDGFELTGEITDDEDWRAGDREWVRLAEVHVRHAALYQCLLASAIYLTEFDERFLARQKLTAEITKLVRAAFDCLSAPEFDRDKTRNLLIMDRVVDRVEQRVGRADLDAVLMRDRQVRLAIDQLAYELYGMEPHRSTIEAALRVVL